eukprot:g552.t1
MSRSDFETCRLLGSGSYGKVYKVVRKSDGLEYAVKEIGLKSLSKKEKSEALNEIRILASVTHKHIIRFCEAFIENNTLHIVTEYAKKGDLGKKIKRYRSKNQMIHESNIWSYLYQICSALSMLHENKILHRDIKPKNIFLTPSDKVKLGDLGCSKLSKKGLANTQVGTPYYMSPEMWMNTKYNDKSDIWALGCVLHELCTLKPPFLANDIKGLSQKVRYAPCPNIPSAYSADLATLIKSMLADRRWSVQDGDANVNLHSTIKFKKQYDRNRRMFVENTANVKLPQSKYPVKALDLQCSKEQLLKQQGKQQPFSNITNSSKPPRPLLVNKRPPIPRPKSANGRTPHGKKYRRAVQPGQENENQPPRHNNNNKNHAGYPPRNIVQNYQQQKLLREQQIINKKLENFAMQQGLHQKKQPAQKTKTVVEYDSRGHRVYRKVDNTHKAERVTRNAAGHRRTQASGYSRIYKPTKLWQEADTSL